MYKLINANISKIIERIEKKHTHITTYDYLVTNIERAGDTEYQNKYKSYWQLYGRGLSQKFHETYFDLLVESYQQEVNSNNLTSILTELYEATDNHSIQFSFATKLLHMVNPNCPIYDSMVASFFFHERPNSNWETKRRIGEFMNFYEFLEKEYERIVNDRLLDDSIKKFRKKFSLEKHFKDVKIIDSLIWAFVQIQNNSLINGEVAYS